MALLGHALARPQSVGCTAWEWTRDIQGERMNYRVRILSQV
jgi:hypothetical protein